MSNKNASIDPKKRCLHRIAHNLNMKIRKHYYGFFVILESFKKNNIWLQRQIICPQRIEQGLMKVNQSLLILYSKKY